MEVYIVLEPLLVSGAEGLFGQASDSRIEPSYRPFGDLVVEVFEDFAEALLAHPRDLPSTVGSQQRITLWYHSLNPHIPAENVDGSET